MRRPSVHAFTQKPTLAGARPKVALPDQPLDDRRRDRARRDVLVRGRRDHARQVDLLDHDLAAAAGSHADHQHVVVDGERIEHRLVLLGLGLVLERRRVGRLVSAFWYLTRGTGIVALILLTGSVALGIANVRRVRLPGAPRFVTLGIHRTASLLAVVFVAVHVLTAVADGYVPLTIVDAVVPFSSAYHPLWIGLGAISLDLLLAVVLTSLLRRRIGYRAWRLVHWTAYASWPIALLHSIGTGSDAGSLWMIALILVLVGVMIAAVLARLSIRRTAAALPSSTPRRRQAGAGVLTRS